MAMGRVKPKEHTLDKIQAVDRTKAKKLVQSFLGLTGFYREFIPKYAEVAGPLIELTKKGGKECSRLG